MFKLVYICFSGPSILCRERADWPTALLAWLCSLCHKIYPYSLARDLLLCRPNTAGFLHIASLLVYSFVCITETGLNWERPEHVLLMLMGMCNSAFKMCGCKCFLLKYFSFSDVLFNSQMRERSQRYCWHCIIRSAASHLLYLWHITLTPSSAPHCFNWPPC